MQETLGKHVIIPSPGKFAVALDNFSLSPPRERKILSHSGH